MYILNFRIFFSGISWLKVYYRLQIQLISLELSIVKLPLILLIIRPSLELPIIKQLLIVVYSLTIIDMDNYYRQFNNW